MTNKDFLAYVSYDYHDSNETPVWVEILKKKDFCLYDPALPITEQNFDLEILESPSLQIKCPLSLIRSLGLPSGELVKTLSEIKDLFPQIQKEAQQGHAVAMLLIQNYFLVRSSIVIVDGNSTFQSGPAVDLVLASQLGIATILVCDTIVQPPWMMTYADLSVTTPKLERVLAGII